MKNFKKLPFKLPNFSELNEKNKNLFLGGLLLGIFLFYWFILMQPLAISPLIKLGPKIQANKNNLKEARLDIKMINEYRQQTQELKEKTKVVGMRILTKEEIPAILDNISRLAIAEDIHINQIMPLTSSQVKEYQNDEGQYFAVPIKVEARGGYHNFGRFLDRLEKDKIFLSVTNFTIAANNNDTYNHSLSMTIKVFILDRTKTK